MKAVIGNAFTIASSGDVICITTNGEVRTDGLAVMGKGIAEFARDTFTGIDAVLAKYLKLHGNRSFNLGQYQYEGKTFTLASFPTKHQWRENSDLRLIQKSCIDITLMADKFKWTRVWVPMPGGGNGGLSWSEIEPVVSILDDRFIVFTINELDFAKQTTLI